MSFKNKKMASVILAILVIVPIILIILPANTFDQGPFTFCFIKWATQHDCYGCGLTRACMYLIHLDFNSAAYYHKGSFFVLPIICIVWLREIIKFYKIVFEKNMS